MKQLVRWERLRHNRPMESNKVELLRLVWAAITVLVVVLLLMLDISRQRESLQLESRVVYEFAYERTLVNEVLLQNFVELVESNPQDMQAIARYSRALRELYPHVRRLQLYQRVEAHALEAHQRSMRERGFSEYAVRSKTDGAELNSDNSTLFYPVVFVEPMNSYGLKLLGKDGYSIPQNRQALIQASYYLSVFATDPYPLEDGKMGYRLMHAVDPAYTHSSEADLIVGLVLSVNELLPPLPHIQEGVSVRLYDDDGTELVSRDNSVAFGGWMLPKLLERRAITRFGQSLELQVEKQLLWSDLNWPVEVIVLLFSIVTYLFTVQGYRRRLHAEREMRHLNVQLKDERDLLEQRVLERTQELVTRNAELHSQVQENRRLIQRVLDIQETERRNIARELHDEMGQALTAIRTDARLMQQLTDETPDSMLHTAANAIDTTAQRIYGVTYGLMRALRPAALDDLGLVDGLKQCISSFNFDGLGIHFHLDLSGPLNELPDSVSIHCYRLVQEGLNNSVKYSRANNLWLSVNLVEGESCKLLIRIDDDGIGFDTRDHQQGFGLIGMRERALANSGEFHIDSAPGKGTRIRIELPIETLNPEASLP